MAESATALASAARRTGLLTVLWEQRTTVTLADLNRLLRTREYGEDLGQITVADLFDLRPNAACGESVEDEVMRLFRARPGIWLSSSFFVRRLGLRRWTAQGVLASLAERGHLIRTGQRSTTRYCLAARHELLGLEGRDAC
jgi:hypothetical protein